MSSAAVPEPDRTGDRPRPSYEVDRGQPCPELFEAWLGDAGRDVLVDDAPGPTVGPVDATRAFRDVLGRFASGVTVVTAVHDGKPVGLTCQSFSSVSLDPPLVLFVPSRTSRAWPLIQETGSFCVNLLASDQAWVSNIMASKGADKFAEVEWRPSSRTGSPVLGGTLGHVDCTVEAVHEAGDHDVVVGRVLTLAGEAPGDPLIFYRGRYRTTG
jgi:3-hydroxy-9,10-secoandrosta-1,3,5(10)-triene-9,17-dione monooxygenase reductase component